MGAGLDDKVSSVKVTKLTDRGLPFNDDLLLDGSSTIEIVYL
ncbi:hypothetical protein [Streptomyces bambusae]|nr:hypothetical protein [Streptomyces bambusae]